MSLGDDGYGGDSRSGRTDDGYSTLGGTRQTRTRFADGTGGDGYGGSRRPARSSRSLTMVVGVVVLLVAAIAFANMGGGDDDSGSSGGSGGGKAGAAPTAATGTKPVTGKNGKIASGFAHNEQGRRARQPITQWRWVPPRCSTPPRVGESCKPPTTRLSSSVSRPTWTRPTPQVSSRTSG